jgi:hypothetical protein
MYETSFQSKSKKRLVLLLARIFGEFQDYNKGLINCKTNTFRPGSESRFQHDDTKFSIQRIVTHYNLPSYFGLTSESLCLHPSSPRRIPR